MENAQEKRSALLESAHKDDNQPGWAARIASRPLAALHAIVRLIFSIRRFSRSSHPRLSVVPVKPALHRSAALQFHGLPHAKNLLSRSLRVKALVSVEPLETRSRLPATPSPCLQSCLSPWDRAPRRGSRPDRRALRAQIPRLQDAAFPPRPRPPPARAPAATSHRQKESGSSFAL